MYKNIGQIISDIQIYRTKNKKKKFGHLNISDKKLDKKIGEKIRHSNRTDKKPDKKVGH